MKRDSYCVLVSATCYVLLIIAFFKLETDVYEGEIDECRYETPCVNICPGITLPNRNLEEFVEKKFERNEPVENITFLTLPLKCSLLEKVGIYEEKWEFSSDGSIYLYGDSWDINKYFDKYFLDYNNEVEWKLQVCMKNFKLISVLRLILFFTAISSMLIPVVIYLLLPELRNNHGKMCIALCASNIIMLLALNYLMFHINHKILAILLYICAYSSNFIMNAMCFDIYLTFKNFRDPNQHSKWFKIFLWIMLSFTVVIGFMIWFEDIYNTNFFVFITYLFIMSYITFFILLLISIFSLIAAFYHMIRVGRSSDRSEHTRYDLEKERYWTIVNIFAILIVMRIIEVICLLTYQSYESKMIADVIKAYSAILVTYLLVWKPKIHHVLFEKYKVMNNVNEDLNNV